MGQDPETTDPDNAPPSEPQPELPPYPTIGLDVTVRSEDPDVAPMAYPEIGLVEADRGENPGGDE